jgi:uncharacterized protein
LADATRIAAGLKLLEEEKHPTEWGGWYSIFKAKHSEANTKRGKFISIAAKLDAIELELAATAAFLYAKEGIGKKGKGDPWQETARRKPDKAAKLERAKSAYRQLLAITTPRPLPPIA